MASRELAKNRILNLLDLTFLDDRTMASPSVYGIALSTACDLKCPHCMREALGIRENKFMDLDALAAHEDDLRDARRILLFGLGEPFLHPRFFDFLKMSKDLGVVVGTTSHGMSLTPETREKIIDHELDELTVSMDGTTKEIFDALRVGAEFNTVVENVTALSALKKARGSELPVININMTIMTKNIHQVAELIRLAHRMGAQSVSYSSVVVYQDSDADANVLETPELAKALEDAERLSRRLGIPMEFWRQKTFGWKPDDHNPDAAYGCMQLWSDEIIERDGLMKLCCYIEEDISDAFKMGPREAFNSEPKRRQRRALMEGRVRPECQGCHFLAERSPTWIQATINEAAKQTVNDPDLTDDDRRDLFDRIATLQTKKDALHPRHGYRKFPPSNGNGSPSSEHPTTRPPELTVY